ncbi:hypothetical protein BJY59DRAFT_697053 [Rhodotorula toruloides]
MLERGVLRLAAEFVDVRDEERAGRRRKARAAEAPIAVLLSLGLATTTLSSAAHGLSYRGTRLHMSVAVTLHPTALPLSLLSLSVITERAPRVSMLLLSQGS